MREEILLDRDWFFHRGEVELPVRSDKAAMYLGAKTLGAVRGPANRNYPITEVSSHRIGELNLAVKFHKVEIPHDYVAGDEPDRAHNEALGFCRCGNAWYLRHFTLDAADAEKRVTLYFEGVAKHATVWVNSALAGRNLCGYVPFELDITDLVLFGEENTVSVYVNGEENEGWWYEGAGIFRPVYLVKTEKVSIDRYGVYVHPERGEEGWRITPRITLRNDGDRRRALRAVCTLYDAEGNEGGTVAISGMVGARETRELRGVIEVGAPRLWSPEDPYLYTLVTELYAGNVKVDESRDRFGFRAFCTDPENGLFINGKPYKIFGFCGHENGGVYGKVVPDSIQRYRVRMMKEMGANGYRTAHYPQSRALMDALDENGFIVMDETRWFRSTEEGLAQLSVLVRRDRNRPSVFFWSLGNEEIIVKDARGKRIFDTMKAHLLKLDDTRPVTTAVTHAPESATVSPSCDVIAVNYQWEHYDEIRRAYPDKAVFSSECGACGTTRGWYHAADPARGFLSAYDTDINNAFRSRENTWKFLMERPWVMGGYHWILSDHRGEAAWPRISSVSGALDLYYQKRDAFYQHQSFFSEKPMIHLLPHWTHTGEEGLPVRVVAYTNAPRAELFLDGKSLGVAEVARCSHAEWQVPYAAGTLSARAYDAAGNVVAEDEKRTAGAPAALRLTLETEDVRAGEYAMVFCSAMDANGEEVPEAEPLVHFLAEGAGRVFSTGASNTDHLTLFSPDRRLFMGRGTAFVKLAPEGGVCRVTARAEGLAAAVLTFEIH